MFDLLRSKASVGYECFASPLNAHFSRFGSAFPDVDAPFGSGGSFFRCGRGCIWGGGVRPSKREGCWEA